tara:strand:+ start:4473 stop:5648 length:1176 start_codon:yes stop_codon:yes gene_type:complete
MKKQKICIIGGGLTGLVTAIILSRLNLKIDLITGAVKQNINTNRTTSISEDNYNYLCKSNILKINLKDFWPCHSIKLYSDNSDKKIDEIFQLKEKKDTRIFYTINNNKLTNQIFTKIKNEKIINIKSSKNVTKIFSNGLLKNVQLSNKESSKYNLIIICAGNNSNLLKNFDQKKNHIKKSYNEVSITTIIKHKRLNNKTARQLFLNDGIIALLPISNDSTSIVWSLSKNLFKEYNKSHNYFKKKIEIYAKDFLKNIKFVSKIEVKDLNLLIRKKYYEDRVLLFGDALHTIHPFVGQGFNMILRDLSCFEKILKQKINLGLDIGNGDVLSEFSKEAKPRNFIFQISVDLLKNCFTYQNNSLKNWRNIVLKNLDNNKFTKSQFMKFANLGFRF